MGATAFLTPNWRFVVFLTAVYILVGAYLVSLPSTIPSGPFGSGAVGMFNLIASVITFSGLGMPFIIQLAFAIPCGLMLAWQTAAFINAGVSTLTGGVLS
jgi:hypothetical protein